MSLSKQLADSFDRGANVQPRRPFCQSMVSTPRIVSHGPMSFDINMYGTETSFSFEHSPIDLSEGTATRIAQLQAKLNQKLGPEFISQRPGPAGGPKLTYAEGWKIINIANEVFGFNGWSSNVVSLSTDYLDYNEESKRYNVGVTAIMRVTLRDGAFHEDVGYGMLENSKSKGAALDKCKKEAVTDGLKRALRNFGNLLGNCLYDKNYTQEVVKIKVSPPKFDAGQLHRAPRFGESQPVGSTRNSINNASTVSTRAPPQVTPTASNSRPQEQHISARSCLQSGIATSMSSTVKTPIHHKDDVSNPKLGLNTPEDTYQRPNPPQRPVLGPQPAARRVSFVEPATHEATEVSIPEREDSFSITSEDEAFFAGLDLGDIAAFTMNEVDMGRPINFEEGMGGIEVGVDQSSDEGVASKTPSVALNAFASDIKQERWRQPAHIDAHMGRESTGILPGTEHVINNANNLQQNQTCSTNTCLEIDPKSLSNQNQTRSLPPVPPDASTPSISNRNSIYPANEPSSRSSAAPETKRATTPSVGGFHFPSGVNPFSLQNQSMRNPPQTSNSTSANRHGTKRPADAMPRQVKGMGLAQNQAMGRREPLGQLEIGERGEVKRVKR